MRLGWGLERCHAGGENKEDGVEGDRIRTPWESLLWSKGPDVRGRVERTCGCVRKRTDGRE